MAIVEIERQKWIVMCTEKISFWAREEAGTQDVHGVAQAGGAGALD